MYDILNSGQVTTQEKVWLVVYITHKVKAKNKLDIVGSTVRYEMMKLCTGYV